MNDESSWGYAVNGAELRCVKRGVFLSFALFWLKLLPPNGLLSTCCQFQNCYGSLCEVLQYHSHTMADATS